MQTTSNQGAAGQTIACLLDRESFLARLEVISTLNSEALLRRERQDKVLHLAYRNQGTVETRVRELAVLEKQCCPFFDFAVSVEGDEVRLVVTAPEEGVALLDEVFAGGGAAAKPAKSGGCGCGA
jgi:hypothetical protein